MALVNWGNNCDVYVQAEPKGYTVGTRASHPIIPTPDFWPVGLFTSVAWGLCDLIPVVEIKHPAAASIWQIPTPKQVIEVLLWLKKEGFRVPDSAIKTMLK